MTDAPRPKPTLARFLPLALILVVAAIIFATGAQRYLTLDALKEHRAALETLVEENLVVAILLFALGYVAVAALSLPGATIMSLLGGFLFGPIIGTAIVVVSATIGATIIFTAAQTALGDSLRRRAGPFVKKMEEGFKDNAFSYLLLLRLIPLFPFFIINIAPSLFDIRLRTFTVATFIGIIPGAFAFVSAGAGLGTVLNAGGEVELTGLLTQPTVLTPIVALSLLALLPIAAKKMGLLKSGGAEQDA